MDNKLKTLNQVRYIVKNTNSKVNIIMYCVIISIVISLINLVIN